MPEFSPNIVSKLSFHLTELIDGIKLYSEALDNADYKKVYDSIQIKLNNYLAKLEKLEHISLVEKDFSELNILLDECYNLNQSVRQDTQERFLLFQTDTQNRNQITMLVDSYELKANSELDAWFKKLIIHYNSIIKSIDYDIQRQVSLVNRLKLLIISLGFKSITTTTLKESIVQCIDLLKSFSRNELYISGTTHISNYIDLMTRVPVDKLTAFDTYNLNSSTMNDSFSKTRNSIIESLKHSVNRNPDNYNEHGNTITEKLFEKDKFITANDFGFEKYLKDYVQYSLGDIIDRLIANLNTGFITNEYKPKSSLNYYRDETITARKELKRRLSSNLYSYIQLIKTRINTNFNTFDAYLLTEQRLIELHYNKLSSIDQKIEKLKHLLMYNN